MKRTLIILMLPALILLTAINPVSAAGEIDLLRGVTFTKHSGTGNANNVDRMTDGNDGTYTSWFGSTSVTATFSYVFPQPVNISSGKFVVGTGNGSRSASYSIYDSSGTRIATASAGGKSLAGVINIPALYDVKEVRVSGGVYISSGSGNEYSNVGSIELYEASGNPDVHLFVINGLAANQSDEAAVRLRWDAIKSNYFDHYKVYKDGEFIATTKVTSLLIDELEFGETYEFSVSPVDTMDKEYSSSAVSYTVPIPKPPEKPMGLKAQMNAGYTRILVTWDKSTESNLAGYDLYISEDGGEEVKLNNSLLTTNSYTYANFKVDSLYEFRLIAVDQKGRKSEPSVTSIKAIEKPTTESEQEETNSYLLVKWSETEGATGYRIYLNGRLIATVGAEVREFKITKEMGYIPGSLVNKSEVKAIFPDGSEGGSSPGSGLPGEYLDFIGVKPAIETAISFLWIYRYWIILVLAVVFSPVLYSLLVRLVNYAREKNWIRS